MNSIVRFVRVKFLAIYRMSHRRLFPSIFFFFFVLVSTKKTGIWCLWKWSVNVTTDSVSCTTQWHFNAFEFVIRLHNVTHCIAQIAIGSSWSITENVIDHQYKCMALELSTRNWKRSMCVYECVWYWKYRNTYTRNDCGGGDGVLGCCRSNRLWYFCFRAVQRNTRSRRRNYLVLRLVVCEKHIKSGRSNDAELSACLAIDSVGWVYTIFEITNFLFDTSRATNSRGFFIERKLYACACINFGKENIYYSESRTENTRENEE